VAPQLTQETPSSGLTPDPRPEGPASAIGAWQTMQRGLLVGSDIESASAMREARAVVRVAYEWEWASSWDQMANWPLRSPAPPWHPLVEHVLAASGTVSAPNAIREAAKPTAKHRPLLNADRIFIGFGGRAAPINQYSGARDKFTRQISWTRHSACI
jgi:hypothetical protein